MAQKNSRPIYTFGFATKELVAFPQHLLPVPLEIPVRHQSIFVNSTAWETFQTVAPEHAMPILVLHGEEQVTDFSNSVVNSVRAGNWQQMYNLAVCPYLTAIKMAAYKYELTFEECLHMESMYFGDKGALAPFTHILDGHLLSCGRCAKSFWYILLRQASWVINLSCPSPEALRGAIRNYTFYEIGPPYNEHVRNCPDCERLANHFVRELSRADWKKKLEKIAVELRKKKIYPDTHTVLTDHQYRGYKVTILRSGSEIQIQLVEYATRSEDEASPFRIVAKAGRKRIVTDTLVKVDKLHKITGVPVSKAVTLDIEFLSQEAIT